MAIRFDRQERVGIMATVETHKKAAQHLRGVFQKLEGNPIAIKCDLLSRWYSQGTKDLDRFRVWLFNQGAADTAEQLAKIHGRIIQSITAFEVELRHMGISNHRELLDMDRELKECENPHLRKMMEQEYRTLLGKMDDIKERYGDVDGSARDAVRLIGYAMETLDEKPIGPDWSTPMPKKSMMVALKLPTYEKFHTYVKKSWLDEINHTTYRIDKNRLTPSEKKQIEAVGG
jgi:hypothetical protein